MSFLREISVKWVLALLLLVYSIVLVYFCWNPQNMSSSWSGPFYSGAAHLTLALKWRVNIKEIEEFERLSTSERNQYRFKTVEQDETSEYLYPLNKGFLFVTWLARTVFFKASDANAIRYFQLTVHFLLSILLLCLFDQVKVKVLFWLGYAANPLIIWISTYPFYYYWQELPSLWLACRYFAKGRSAVFLDGVSPFLFFFVVYTRPVMIFVCVFYYVYVLYQRQYLRASVLICCFILAVLVSRSGNQNYSQPWHTFYVGIGAYKNPWNIYMEDNSAYQRVRQMAGLNISTHPSSELMTNPEYRNNYQNLLKNDYFSMLKERPLLLLKNAVLNYFQAFSVGYYGKRVVIVCSTILGMLVWCFLLYRKAYFWLVAASLAVGGFVAYYPPIPAYMFGAYVFTTLGVILELVKIEKLNRMLECGDGFLRRFLSKE